MNVTSKKTSDISVHVLQTLMGGNPNLTFSCSSEVGFHTEIEWVIEPVLVIEGPKILHFIMNGVPTVIEMEEFNL